VSGPGVNDRWMVHAAGLAAIAIIAWLTMLLGIGPVLADAATIRERDAAALALSTEAALARSALQQVHRRVEAVEAQLQDVPLQVQPLSALNRRYADIIALAGRCDVRVSESRTEAPRPETWFVRVPIELEGRGPVDGVAAFFRQLRSEIPDVEILAFQVTRVGGTGGSEMTLVVNLAWYAASDEGDSAVRP